MVSVNGTMSCWPLPVAATPLIVPCDVRAGVRDVAAAVPVDVELARCCRTGSVATWMPLPVSVACSVSPAFANAALRPLTTSVGVSPSFTAYDTSVVPTRTFTVGSVAGGHAPVRPTSLRLRRGLGHVDVVRAGDGAVAGGDELRRRGWSDVPPCANRLRDARRVGVEGGEELRAVERELAGPVDRDAGETGALRVRAAAPTPIDRSW